MVAWFCLYISILFLPRPAFGNPAWTETDRFFQGRFNPAYPPGKCMAEDTISRQCVLTGKVLNLALSGSHIQLGKMGGRYVTGYFIPAYLKALYVSRLAKKKGHILNGSLLDSAIHFQKQTILKSIDRASNWRFKHRPLWEEAHSDVNIQLIGCSDSLLLGAILQDTALSSRQFIKSQIPEGKLDAALFRYSRTLERGEGHRVFKSRYGYFALRVGKTFHSARRKCTTGQIRQRLIQSYLDEEDYEQYWKENRKQFLHPHVYQLKVHLFPQLLLKKAGVINDSSLFAWIDENQLKPMELSQFDLPETVAKSIDSIHLRSSNKKPADSAFTIESAYGLWAVKFLGKYKPSGFLSYARSRKRIQERYLDTLFSQKLASELSVFFQNKLAYDSFRLQLSQTLVLPDTLIRDFKSNPELLREKYAEMLVRDDASDDAVFEFACHLERQKIFEDRLRKWIQRFKILLTN